ncbi:hypothetical protein HDU96_010953 [Phlyctochytrium bullatum]|nr:hypothetical protein HDU96_010953 [Phlyctochytrium bullatum]
MVAIFSIVTALLAASAANAAVVPKTVTAIRAKDSTPSALTLDLDVVVELDPAVDTTPVDIPFTFGSADAAFTFGTGVLSVNPNGVDSAITATASATWTPEAGEATKAANAVLSQFCSNNPSTISVSPNGLNASLPVTVNGVGVAIVEKLVVYVTTRTPVTGQSQAQIQLFNPFLLPLTFTALNATATAPQVKVGAGNQDLLIGTITQDPLGANQFVVPPTSAFLTNKIDAVTKLNLQQVLGLLAAIRGANNSLPVNAVASSNILIGNYPASVSFNQVITAGLGSA